MAPPPLWFSFDPLFDLLGPCYVYTILYKLLQTYIYIYIHVLIYIVQISIRPFLVNRRERLSELPVAMRRPAG